MKPFRPITQVKTQPLSPTDANPEFRSGVIESEMENRFKLIARKTSGVAAVSNVCGQPTSPTSAGVNSPQLAGLVEPGSTRKLGRTILAGFASVLPKQQKCQRQERRQLDEEEAC
ncbi:hypothetical protein OS493_032262 [Desmophyllum pertusum]|uniref:Uncharacterized protein n=1 Tax=Desmophyllum pertusum TaxID=174260 RepID=A0A9X0CV64_9CNID|nr:hypothetical protein OS493_032262 [Desmophyllum pertusum]